MKIGIVGYTGWMGAWHLHVLDRAARELGIEVTFSLFSRGGKPAASVNAATVYSDVEQFCNNHYDLLVLAVHPEHRLAFYETFGSQLEGTCIFLEKPLSSSTAAPDINNALLHYERLFGPNTIVNYPELYDPLTPLLLTVLAGKCARVPALSLREIQCNRSKDREHAALPGNDRATESLVIQEGVHDLSFVLYVLQQAGDGVSFPSLRLVSSSGTDLAHPSGSPVKLAGSSYTLLKEPLTGITVSIVNSFADPYVRKEKILVCRGSDGFNYTVVANYQPEHRRCLLVYNENGSVVYDASADVEVAGALTATKEQWNLEFMKQLLVQVGQGQLASNFALADVSEQYAQAALMLQQGEIIH